MKRWCHFCGGEITDERRLARGGVFCSRECKRQHDNEKRAAKAVVKCRLCGRRYRKKAAVAVDPGVCAAAAQEIVVEAR